MSFEWLLVSLPCVFLLGWLAARLDIRHIRRTATELPRTYFRGLSALLAGRQDKALDSFLEAAAITDTPELQFIVGELAQRRGDFGQAMRIHRRLYEREDLPANERNRALWALTNDYYRMGFMDYAERYAESLVSDASFGERAFNLLLKVCHQRHLYAKAAALIEKTGGELSVTRRAMVAQLYCEQARREEARREELLAAALRFNPLCARARLMLAESATPEAACRHYEAIETENADYLWLAVAGYLSAMRGLGKEAEGQRVVLRWLDDYPTSKLLQEIHSALPADNEVVRAKCEEILKEHQSPMAAAYWLEAQPANGGDPKTQMALKSLLLRVAGKAFHCRQCEYETDDFSWSCPGCLQWETFAQRDD